MRLTGTLFLTRFCLCFSEFSHFGKEKSGKFIWQIQLFDNNIWKREDIFVREICNEAGKLGLTSIKIRGKRIKTGQVNLIQCPENADLCSLGRS